SAPARREGGRTVLGHYPEYVEMSDALMARRYEIPADVWDQMTPQERWEANARFLERTIARGDAIELSTRYDRINPDPNNYFRRELNFLESHGYRFSEDGWRMLPPETPPQAAPTPTTPGARGATSSDSSPTRQQQDAARDLRAE